MAQVVNTTTAGQPVQTQVQPNINVPKVEQNKDKRKKIHKVLGEYVKCIVYPTKYAQQNTSIFVSINMNTFEFQPEVEIEIPKGVVKFLREATAVEHFYDKNGTSDNGNKGCHSTRYPKMYIVEIID